MEITAPEVHQRLEQGEEPFLLDVREPWEYAQSRIAGAVLIPLGELMHRVGEVPQDQTVVAICHLGSRSGLAASWLRQRGYSVLNMSGGMDAWEHNRLPVEHGS